MGRKNKSKKCDKPKKADRVVACVTVQEKLEPEFDPVRPLFICYGAQKGVLLEAYQHLVVQPNTFGIWCPFCFLCADQMTIGMHLKQEECEWRDRTPGLLIYSFETVQVYEIDPDIDSKYCNDLLGHGKVQKVRTMNPDNKKLVGIEHRHMVYLVVKHCYNGNIPVGFFTKDKLGKGIVLDGMWVFRWYTKLGFDTFMLAMAYEMAVAQKIIGHVERPWDLEFFKVFEDLVLDTTAQYLFKEEKIKEKNVNSFLMELAEKTAFHPSHVAEILVNQNWIAHDNGQLTLNIGKRQLQDRLQSMESRGSYSNFDKTSLTWKPNKFFPTFSEYQVANSWPLVEFIEELAGHRHNINVDLGKTFYPADERLKTESWKKGRQLVEDHVHCSCDQPGSSGSQCFCNIFF